MFKLIHARHALNKNTTVTDDMYIGECQDLSKFSQDLVQFAACRDLRHAQLGSMIQTLSNW